MTDFKKRILGKGKKFYTEVLERRTVSDKLPVFQKMRTGTEIFIIEKEKRNAQIRFLSVRNNF